jgi:hypothetical protein
MGMMKSHYFSHERVAKEIELMMQLQQLLQQPEPWNLIIDLVQQTLGAIFTPFNADYRHFNAD